MKIHAPEIFDPGTDCVQVRAYIEYSGGSDYLWYSITREYSDFLVTENADAFLVGLLLLAMKHGEDIYIESSISEKLFYNLENYYTKIIKILLPNLKRIKIFPENLNSQTLVQNQNGGVITGFSSGIDSFCVLSDHLFRNTPHSYKITHLICNNVGAFGSGGRELFKIRYARSKAFATAHNLPFIGIDSNLHDFFVGQGIHFHSSHFCRNASAVLSIQKLARKYLYASAYRYEDCAATPSIYQGSIDPFSVHLLSTETTECISTGCQYSRVEKTMRVSEISQTYQYLNVCIRNSGLENCSNCYKCLRTLLTLEIGGKLSLYDKVFSMQRYQSARTEYLSAIVRSNDAFDKEIVQMAQDYGYQFPFWCQLLPPQFFKIFPNGIKIRNISSFPQKLKRLFRKLKTPLN